MLKHFKKLMSNQKQRTGIIISAISIFIAAIIIFIGFELKNNQSLVIDNFVREQQLITDQVSLRIKYYMESEQLAPSEAIERILGEVQTTGNSYWFFAEDSQLLFVKNSSTSGLFTYITLEDFIRDNIKANMKITTGSFQVGEKLYTIGNCTAKEYINEAGQTFKHNIYIIMPLILITAVMLVVFIVGLLIINRQENKINQLSAEAVDRNITIEQLTARMKKTRLNNLSGAGEKHIEGNEETIYNKEVLVSLLDKINRENIVPLTIIIIELTSKDNTYLTEDYHHFIKAAARCLRKEHVLAEIIPGVFTILMFHSAIGNKDEIKRTLIHEWALPLKKKGVKVRMGISCIEDYDSNVESIFEIVYREVSGMHQEERIELSS